MVLEYIVMVVLLITVVTLTVLFYRYSGKCTRLLNTTVFNLNREWEYKLAQSRSTQRGTIKGQTMDRFALYLDGLPYQSNDVYPMHHSPVDFVAFKGLTSSNGSKCESVDFLELKTGSHKNLKVNQSAIKDCIVAGKVNYFKVSIESVDKFFVDTDYRHPLTDRAIEALNELAEEDDESDMPDYPTKPDNA